MSNKPETAGFVMNQAMLRIKDPDGYWIEILSPRGLANIVT